jgi:hypothetical protein
MGFDTPNYTVYYFPPTHLFMRIVHLTSLIYPQLCCLPAVTSRGFTRNVGNWLQL